MEMSRGVFSKMNFQVGEWGEGDTHSSTVKTQRHRAFGSFDSPGDRK